MTSTSMPHLARAPGRWTARSNLPANTANHLGLVLGCGPSAVPSPLVRGCQSRHEPGPMAVTCACERAGEPREPSWPLPVSARHLMGRAVSEWWAAAHRLVWVAPVRPSYRRLRLSRLGASVRVVRQVRRRRQVLHLPAACTPLARRRRRRAWVLASAPVYSGRARVICALLVHHNCRVGYNCPCGL